MRPNTEVDVWAQTLVTDGCWHWLGARSDGGYGTVRLGGKTLRAHRAMYEFVKGPIPVGLTLDHLCRNRACVNPDHLEPVTFKENCLRGNGLPAKNSRKTHCMHGHELSGDTVLIDSRGKRQCRECERQRGKRRRGQAAVDALPEEMRKEFGG